MGERLKDKVVFFSGAGSIGPGWGNGKAAAVAMAREGARIFALDVNADAVEETASIIREEGNRVETFVCDVSKGDQVEAAVKACMEAFGRIDVLDNNVGVIDPGGPEDLTEAQWDRLMAINVKSIYLTCRNILPIMTKQGGGAIVNVSSIASTHSLGYSCISYSASKGAVNAFTRDIALNYGPKGIRCNTILPGLMNTPLIHAGNVTSVYGSTEEMVRQRDALVPIGKMGDGWDVAWASVFLASDEAKHITGIELVVDGGITLKVK
ncbi:SDR family oxidoreductase [Fulvimarina endophytica]|uniref:SDR family oxidoreductase n=1 Tax=Fulvimarina endophytica TaxID=2293836 RepID=A0A371X4Q5_9HYPH|nr:SDR family NAD(P)-dependent oxidoreductase [Fulvimarina endophytica]RFC64187.1 SDR family oxidoreductase [Fulvimarina endophytica]